MATEPQTSMVSSASKLLHRKDVLAGLLFIAVAVLGLWASRNYPIGTATRMGTGYVPRLLCWILLGLGVAGVAAGPARQGRGDAESSAADLALDHLRPRVADGVRALRSQPLGVVARDRRCWSRSARWPAARAGRWRVVGTALRADRADAGDLRLGRRPADPGLAGVVGMGIFLGNLATRLRRRADAEQSRLRASSAAWSARWSACCRASARSRPSRCCCRSPSISSRCPALIMLAGIYYGAQYGGSTTAILVNMPGETSSVVTCIDGHQMARKGRAGAALAIAALGSFFAGMRRDAADRAVLAAARQGRPVVRRAGVFLADGARPDRRGGAGARLGRQGDRHGAARPAARPRRHRRQHRRPALHLRRHAMLADGIGFVPLAIGRVRHRRGDRQPDRSRSTGAICSPTRSPACGRRCEDFRQAWPAIAARHRASARCSACCRAAARRSRAFAAYALEKKIAQGPVALRQGRDRRRRRPGIRPTTPARRPRSFRC